MAVNTNRPGIGGDVQIFIGTDDRTSWFLSFDPDDTTDTSSNRALGETRNKMHETGITTTIQATVRAVPEAVRFFRTWARTLNEEKDIHFRPEGTASGKEDEEFPNCILPAAPRGAPVDGDQTMSLTFHCNADPVITTQ